MSNDTLKCATCGKLVGFIAAGIFIDFIETKNRMILCDRCYEKFACSTPATKIGKV